jgi:hypothetical protein
MRPLAESECYSIATSRIVPFQGNKTAADSARAAFQAILEGSYQLSLLPFVNARGAEEGAGLFLALCTVFRFGLQVSPFIRLELQEIELILQFHPKVLHRW